MAAGNSSTGQIASGRDCMTLIESAVVLAWFAIALLSMGFAVLVRQTTLISRYVSNEIRGTSPHHPNPVVGLRLPPDTSLQPWFDTGSNLLALYVSSSCQSCRRYLMDCQAEAPLRHTDQPVVVLSREDWSTDTLEWPSNWTCIEHAVREHERVNAPAVPYFAIIRSDRLVMSAGLAAPPGELVAMLDLDNSED